MRASVISSRIGCASFDLKTSEHADNVERIGGDFSNSNLGLRCWGSECIYVVSYKVDICKRWRNNLGYVRE